MDRVQKFLAKLDKKHLGRLKSALRAIEHGQLRGLDIKPLSGQPGWYRCRLGKIRVIFIRAASGKVIVYDIHFRGQAYKKRG